MTPHLQYMPAEASVYLQCEPSSVRVEYALLKSEPHLIGLAYPERQKNFEPLARLWDTDHADLVLESVMFAMSTLAQIVREEGEKERLRRAQL